MTISCICTDFEKQSVWRVRRLIRVLKVRCLRSIFCVLRLARAVNLRLQMPRVGAPMIRIILCDPKGLQQPFQLPKHRILAMPKDIGKDGTHEVIDRVPKLPLFLFLADKRPHLIHLGFASTLDTHGDLVALPSAQQGRVHRLQNRFFLQ